MTSAIVTSICTLTLKMIIDFGYCSSIKNMPVSFDIDVVYCLISTLGIILMVKQYLCVALEYRR